MSFCVQCASSYTQSLCIPSTHSSAMRIYIHTLVDVHLPTHTCVLHVPYTLVHHTHTVFSCGLIHQVSFINCHYVELIPISQNVKKLYLTTHSFFSCIPLPLHDLKNIHKKFSHITLKRKNLVISHLCCIILNY